VKRTRTACEVLEELGAELGRRAARVLLAAARTEARVNLRARARARRAAGARFDEERRSCSMTWSINARGTRKGVLDAVKNEKQLEEAPAVRAFVLERLERMPASQGSWDNGLSVIGSGHGGYVNLTIETIAIKLDPVEAPASAAADAGPGSG
jgi:hypothetical protein